MEVIYLLSFYLLYFTKYDDPKAQQHKSFWLDNYFWNEGHTHTLTFDLMTLKSMEAISLCSLSK